MSSKKSLHVILDLIFSNQSTLGTIFFKLKHVGHHFFQIKARWAPFFLTLSGRVPRFSGILRSCSQILPGFSGNLPGFSPNQNFWGCACTPFTPTSYTSRWHVCRQVLVDGRHYQRKTKKGHHPFVARGAPIANGEAPAP